MHFKVCCYFKKMNLTLFAKKFILKLSLIFEERVVTKGIQPSTAFLYMGAMFFT
jgi:hypothetical protein